MQPAETSHAYCLPAQLSAETADSVAEALRSFSITPNSPVRLDASGVEQLTSSGAQLIVSLHKSLTSAGGELVIDSLTPTAQQALNDMGLGWLNHTLKA